MFRIQFVYEFVAIVREDWRQELPLFFTKIDKFGFIPKAGIVKYIEGLFVRAFPCLAKFQIQFRNRKEFIVESTFLKRVHVLT